VKAGGRDGALKFGATSNVGSGEKNCLSDDSLVPRADGMPADDPKGTRRPPS